MPQKRQRDERRQEIAWKYDRANKEGEQKGLHLNKAIALARDAGDNGTRESLESMLKDEEDSVDWHEAQLGIIKEIGKERYLAEHIHD